MNDRFIEKVAYVWRSEWNCQYQFKNLLGSFKYAMFEYNNETLNDKFEVEPNIWYKIKI